MIKVINGDLFDAQATYICHQVNCHAIMGSGVAALVKAKYPKVFAEYKKFCANEDKLLGKVLSVHCPDGKIVMNLFAQENFGYDGKCYTSYDALDECFNQIKAQVPKDTEIAMPYLMGCHRGGGDWTKVCAMLEEVFVDHTVLLYRKDMG